MSIATDYRGPLAGNSFIGFVFLFSAMRFLAQASHFLTVS
jgi:hypothetical protein